MNWRDVIEFRAPYQTAYFQGTNTRVLRIMLCLANGWTETQILMMHPEIKRLHIKACIQYGEECARSDAEPQIDPQLAELVRSAQKNSSHSPSATQDHS